jgi:glycine/D-amino acid oxidase-like deaminating enzyme
MLKLPQKEISYWQNSATAPSYPTLTEDLEADVIVVGGGIAGLTAAYLLKRSGLTVVVLEKHTIGSGTTSHTTGKLTSQHNLVYGHLAKQLGEKTAKIYAEANQAAVEKTIRIIKKEKIDCELEIDDNYVYTTDFNQVPQFKVEAKLAAKFGLPATFETKLALPFKIRAAVKFTGQAKFNTQKYVLGLAALVNGGGSYIFEHSNVTGFHDGMPASVRTKTGTVTAKNVIVATKIPAAPLIARGAYAALERPHTSYIVAGRLEGKLKGMYISPDKAHYSILPISYEKGQLLLIGGEHHTPGFGNPRKRYRRLADYAEKHFGVSSIAYHWKGMDYIAYDDVPLIGKVYPWSKHTYTATGFKKWGLSTSMVAGIILRDEINGHENSWAPTFNSMRLKPVASIPRVIAKSFIG